MPQRIAAAVAAGWGSNRLQLWAVLVELVALVVFLGPVADVLGHAVPPLEALGVALLGIPAILTADFVYKTVRNHRR